MADLSIRTLTVEEQKVIDEINKMEHEEMARIYRFSTRTEFFDNSKPYWSHFKERFFGHFGGFNP